MAISDRVGLLLVGAGGMTATAVSAGLMAIRKGVLAESYGVTSHSSFTGRDLPSADLFVLGGWDGGSADLYSRLTAYGHVASSIVESTRGASFAWMPAVVCGLDYLQGNSNNFRRPKTIEHAVDLVRSDISGFAEINRVDRVIVVYLASPSRTPPVGFADSDLTGSAAEFPAAVAYALGAIRAGADFVDFTPSYTLEYRAIWEEAARLGVNIAGRDGSTGQTMLKSAIAELLTRRGLVLSSWYSTNLLGNNDGLVLSDRAFNNAKLHDKRSALQLDEQSHAIDIKYMPDWGDRKESWDAAEVRSWLGGSVSIRVNWRGPDSELAAPMVVDIARLLAAEKRGAGFRPELGFFFKRPFMREHTSLAERWNELVLTFGAKS